MTRFNWQSGTAAFMALSIITGGVASTIAPTPASAQLFRKPGTQTTSQITIPAGVSIPVIYDKAEKIVVTPKETVPITLTVASNIRSRTGAILIPAGSQVVGKLQPAEGGSQFVAEKLVFNEYRSQEIRANSRVITRTTEVRKGMNTTSILTGAAVGSAAATAISGITGDKRITALEVLAGTGVGAVSGWLLGRQKVDVVVINPNSDLALTLTYDLALR